MSSRRGEGEHTITEFLQGREAQENPPSQAAVTWVGNRGKERRGRDRGQRLTGEMAHISCLQCALCPVKPPSHNQSPGGYAKGPASLRSTFTPQQAGQLTPQYSHLTKLGCCEVGCKTGMTFQESSMKFRTYSGVSTATPPGPQGQASLPGQSGPWGKRGG